MKLYLFKFSRGDESWHVLSCSSKLLENIPDGFGDGINSYSLELIDNVYLSKDVLCEITKKVKFELGIDTESGGDE